MNSRPVKEASLLAFCDVFICMNVSYLSVFVCMCASLDILNKSSACISFNTHPTLISATYFVLTVCLLCAYWCAYCAVTLYVLCPYLCVLTICLLCIPSNSYVLYTHISLSTLTSYGQVSMNYYSCPTSIIPSRQYQYYALLMQQHQPIDPSVRPQRKITIYKSVQGRAS
ncbi:hypothetical protein D3C74_115360 [compost metagenome]